MLLTVHHLLRARGRLGVAAGGGDPLDRAERRGQRELTVQGDARLRDHPRPGGKRTGRVPPTPGRRHQRSALPISWSHASQTAGRDPASTNGPPSGHEIRMTGSVHDAYSTIQNRLTRVHW